MRARIHKFFHRKNIISTESSEKHTEATAIPVPETISPITPDQAVAVPVIEDQQPQERDIYDKLINGKLTEKEQHTYLQNLGKDDEGAALLSKVRKTALDEFVADESEEYSTNIYSRYSIFKVVNSEDNRAQIAKAARERGPEKTHSF